MAIEVFNRKEIKYILDENQKEELLKILDKFMEVDKFNRSGKPYSISNLYLDTICDELIRKSLEKPLYKEKIRLRSYGQVGLNEKVFLEIKKKFEGVVNKRRTTMLLSDAYSYFETKEFPKYEKLNVQVMKEIDKIMKFYDLHPRVFIAYDRFAFFEKGNSDFRLTLDTNIRSRRDDLRLDLPTNGNTLLENGKWLMEAKAFKAFPMWFVRFLSEHKIFQVSFSKYGTEYKKFKMTNSK